MLVKHIFITKMKRNIHPNSTSISVPKEWMNYINETRGHPCGIKIYKRDNEMYCQFIFDKQTDCTKLRKVGHKKITTHYYLDEKFKEFIKSLAVSPSRPRYKEYEIDFDIERDTILYKPTTPINYIALNSESVDRKSRKNKEDMNHDVNWLIEKFDECLKTPKKLATTNFKRINKTIQRLRQSGIELVSIP